MSIDNDEYYYNTQFESNIRDIIVKIEIEYGVLLNSGTFDAVEYRPMGNQYRYTISLNTTEPEKKRILINRKILNWNTFHKKN